MIPQPNEIYKHFKGNLYKIITIATHSETREKMVVYQALYGDYGVYVRPLSMFSSKVDHDKYPEVEQEYRFERVDEILGNISTSLVTESDIEDEKNMESVVEDVNGVAENAQLGAVDPLILEFLDAETYQEKSNILTALHHRINDEIINTLAAALDIVIDDGDLEIRYIQLKNCVATKGKFECNRI